MLQVAVSGNVCLVISDVAETMRPRKPSFGVGNCFERGDFAVTNRELAETASTIVAVQLESQRIILV